MMERVTWALREKGYNRQYLQNLTPTYAEWTFKRNEALRFLTREAAVEERKGWVDPKARANLVIVQITTKV